MKKKIIITEKQITEAVKNTLIEYLEGNLATPLELNNSQETLIEMARIDEPSKDSSILGTKEVWVYGQDRSSMSPHFHYFDKKNKPFNIEVRIADLTVCHSAPRQGISINNLNSWEGLSREHKALLKWLESNNSDIPTITNYQALKLAWNQNNRDNKTQ